ncbi:MAG: ECF transporter S component [Ruminiclostridium sp.]|nr:ECF transporter S component [Ruminiclostridium sp.]
MSTAAKTVRTVNKKSISNTKFITITAILTAIAVVLQYLEFPVPMFIPPFVKFDFSDLPAILAAFLVSPVSGVLVCLLKNVIHIAVSQSAGVGELCNFLLGAVMVVPAWLIYKIKPSKGMAAAAMAVGSLITAVVSIFINYFITYPFYQEAYHLPIDAIIGMYRELNGGVGTLWDALIWFNAPFTFVKFLLDSMIVFFVYKPLSRAVRKD